MADKYLLGVDVGTAGSKGVITDLAGRVVAYNLIEHETASPQPGWYEHDAEKIWYGDLVRVIRAMLKQSGIRPQEIAAVGLSALCPDMLPIDGDGRPLRPAILYGIDTRATAEMDWITQLFGRDFIFQKSGNLLSMQSVTPKAIWFKRHEPELYARTRKIHTGSSYLVFKLTGEHVLDYGTATFYGPILDIHTLKWDEDISRTMGIEPDLLPRVDYGIGVAGKVTAQAAAETGLAVGTPVIVGACDATHETASAGAVNPGDAGLSCGSTLSLLVVTDHMAMHSSMTCLPYLVPGSYLLTGGTATSGALTRWFRDNFGHVEMETERQLGLNAYHLLSEEACLVPPGAEGLLALPYFAGERTPVWDPMARGTIIGLTVSHTRAHVYRALLEASAFALRHMLDVTAEAGAKVTRLISSGGGTRSRLWAQIISDVTGCPQEVSVSPYGSPIGGAYLAGYGVGIFKDFRTLNEKWVRIGARIEPDASLKPLYDEYYRIYRQVYEHTKDDMHDLARLSCLGPSKQIPGCS